MGGVCRSAAGDWLARVATQQSALHKCTAQVHAGPLYCLHLHGVCKLRERERLHLG